MELKELNVVVIGAGIGGLAAGALLASKGALVTVLEAQEYPGGCAATFSRNGYRFDAGATIGCGFHSGGPMEILGRELGIVWPASPEAVAWQYRHKAIHLDLAPDRFDIIKRFPHSKAFWSEQAALSKLLWSLSEGGLSWPAKGPRDLARLAGKALRGLPGTLHLLKYISSNVLDWLASHSLDTDSDFVRFIDSQLLISVQTTARHANAVNAAIALDLPVSGAYTIRGGIGTVADLLAASIVKNGGAVLYGKNVNRIDSVQRQVFGLETSDGSALAADIVLANLTPLSLARLAEDDIELPVTNIESKEWSAFVLYLGMDPELFSSLSTNHIQVIGDGEELAEGNSIFVSASPTGETGLAPEGLCAVTVSTHTRPGQWFEARKSGEGAYTELKRCYTERVLDLFSVQFPSVREAVRSMTAATPVSWERYTGRVMGCVGGYPQTSLFKVRGPCTRFDNLFLVGDSIFPGQSLPGVVTGARRAVELVARQASKKRG